MKYLAMVYGNPAQTQSPQQGVVPLGSEQVRSGVFKVVAADARYIAAQKRCPVMDEPLDAMGGPYKVNADGKAIYICCPGCAKKQIPLHGMQLACPTPHGNGYCPAEENASKA